MSTRSPPGPWRWGSTTWRTSPAATAASNALPPRSRTAIPVEEASQWVDATIPNVPRSSGRVVNVVPLPAWLTFGGNDTRLEDSRRMDRALSPLLSARSAWPDSLIVTHSGIRAPAEDLTPELVSAVVASFARVLDERGLPMSLAVAPDDRPEGAALAECAADAAQAAGLDVVELGAVSTPTAKLAARKRGLGGAVILTGSHLVAEWNGIKLAIGPRFEHLDPRTLRAPASSAGQRGTRRLDPDAARDHADAVAATVDVDAIRTARLSVAASGGAGGAARSLLELLGCTPPGDAHTDVELLLDPDGDRLQLVDERGELVDTEATLPLVVRARRPRAVVVGLDTSRVVESVAKETGAEVHRVVPGEAHLTAAVLEHGADL